MTMNFSSLKSLNDISRKIDLNPEPLSALLFANGKCRTATAEWIERKITALCGHLNDTIKNLRREGVRAAILGFEFPVTHWRNVCPDILQINPFGVHGVSMSAVVLHFATAVAADLYRCTDSSERSGMSFRIIKQAIVAWMKPARNW